MRSALLTIMIAMTLSVSPLLAQQTTYYEQGVKLYNKGDYKEAIRYFQAAAQQNSADASYYQGLCYQRLGDLANAKRLWLVTETRFPKTTASQAATSAIQQLNRSYPTQTTQATSGPASQADDSPLQQDINVPFFRLSSGHIIVPCAVNGKSVNMMFDTGAADCFFTQEDFDKMGLKVPAGKKKRYLGVGGEVSATVVPVNLSVGALTRPVNVSVQDTSYQRSPATADATSFPLLGQNYFGDLPYQIDSNNNVVRFLKSTSKTAGERVPFKRDGNNLIVTVKVNGRECPMLLDTGADTICFSDKHLASLGINRPTDANAGFSGGVGGRRHSFVFYVDSIKLGSVEKKHVQASVALDSTMDMPLLGASFLQNLILTFDPSNNVVKVSP